MAVDVHDFRHVLTLAGSSKMPLLSLATGDLPVRCFGQRQQSDGSPVATRRGQRFGAQDALANTSELKWIRVGRIEYCLDWASY